VARRSFDCICRVEYAPFVETCKAALAENRNEYLALLKKCVLRCSAPLMPVLLMLCHVSSHAQCIKLDQHPQDNG
jgi:hypothetical protein